MTRFEVTAVGEAMLRLSVSAGHHLETMTNLDVHLGGAESNVCAALAALGRRCSWASRLPRSPLGRYALRALRGANGDTSAVVLADDTRVGTYFVEYGAGPRATEVLYDRAHSAVTGLRAQDLDWDTILDTRVLHLTGITPALGPASRELILEAVRRAHARGVRVSFDVNYRSRLWPADAARRELSGVLPFVDILICGREDAHTVFGIEGSVGDTLSALHRFSGADHVVLTRAHEGAAALWDGEVVEVGAREAVVVDRLGAGDAFVVGFLDGYLQGDVRLGLEQGVVTSALALGQYGDMLVASRDEMLACLAGTRNALRR